MVLADYTGIQELELKRFQQLNIEVLEIDVHFIQNKFSEVGLSCYTVGNYVKSLRHCIFCKEAEEERMPNWIRRTARQ